MHCSFRLENKIEVHAFQAVLDLLAAEEKPLQPRLRFRSGESVSFMSSCVS